MIDFAGKTFPLRNISINFPDKEEILTIGPESLQDAFFTDDYTYVSEKARYLDKNITFYVPDELMKEDDLVLQKYIMENLT